MATLRYEIGDVVEVQPTSGVSWVAGRIIKNAGHLWWDVSIDRDGVSYYYTIPQRRIRRTDDQGKG